MGIVVVVVVFMVGAMILVVEFMIAVAVAVADSVFRIFYPCISGVDSGCWFVRKMWRWKKASRLSGRRRSKRGTTARSAQRGIIGGWWWG